MRELSVQAASTGSSDIDARNAAQAEVTQLLAEVDRISSTTRFGGSKLLDGTYGVTQAAVHGESAAGFTVDAANGFGSVNNAFTIDIDGAGAIAATEVTIAAGTYTTFDAATAAALEDNLRRHMVADLAQAGLDYEAVSVSVKVADDGVGFVTTFSGTKGNDISLGPGLNENVLDNLNIAHGTYTASGSGGVFQVGASAAETISFATSDVGTGSSGLNVAGINVATGASAAITSLDAAIKEVATLRGNLGALQNRFEHTISNLSVTMENLSASESRIRDTDMAAEMMQFTRSQILQHAGTAMLSQANQLPQSVLQLLR